MIQLSEPTLLPKTTHYPISFSTNILIVGGAYSGLSALNTFITNFKEKSKHHIFNSNYKLSITLIDPRAGLLNIIGMSRCIVDDEFSKTQFLPYHKIKNLKYDNIVSYDTNLSGSFVRDLNGSGHEGLGLVINYVQGKVTYLDEHKAQYQLVKDDEFDKTTKPIIDFNYVILASGRDRFWPTTPKAFTYDFFIDEMKASKQSIIDHDIISVVGGGAVGIELAGDFKNYLPQKTVNLIHSHDTLLREPLLHQNFKQLTLESLQNSGVNVILNTRIKNSDLDGNQGITFGDLTTNDEQTIKSELNIWCTTHQNNTSFLSKHLQKKYITPNNCIRINEYLQLSDSTTIVPNFFVLGDLVDLPIIKSAGWALYHGRQVANNLTSLLFENKFVEPHPDVSQMPKGMVLVAGNQDLICQLADEIAINVPEFVEEYKDYCFGKVMATMGIIS